MQGRIFFGIVFAYGIVLLAASFFVHLFPVWFSAALLVLTVACVALCEPAPAAGSMALAIIAGVFADMFSGLPAGEAGISAVFMGLALPLPLWTLTFGAFGVAIKYIAVKYVRFPSF